MWSVPFLSPALVRYSSFCHTNPTTSSRFSSRRNTYLSALRITLYPICMVIHPLGFRALDVCLV